MKVFLDEDPSRETINLENQEIAAFDSSSLLLMSKFKNLKVLNLSENLLTSLPANMSILTSLEEINLTNNPIEKIEAVTDAIFSIGP